METQWLDPDSPRWAEILAQHAHDFYHLPSYLKLSAQQEGGQAHAFLAQERGRHFFLPLLFRPIPNEFAASETFQDATSPYGYGGPLMRTQDAEDTDFLTGATAALVAGLRERRAVSAFVRLHPLLPVSLAALEAGGAVVSTGETVTLDLTLPKEELWRQTRSGHRSEINKMRRNGYVPEIVPYEEYLPEFETIYAQTMRRVGATEQYLFPHAYFLGLHAALEGRLHLCVVRIEGEIACAGLFSEVCGIVQYHLSGVRDEFVHYHPAKLMLDHVRDWAQERGNRLMHLGGGLGGRRDTLFDFKAGFSRWYVPFYTWRVIADPPTYGRLTCEWHWRAQMEPEGQEGFFPAYRKPLP